MRSRDLVRPTRGRLRIEGGFEFGRIVGVARPSVLKKNFLYEEINH